MYLEFLDEFEKTYRTEYKNLSDYIWDNPETAFEEYNSSAVLISHLKKNGYKVTKGLAGIDTAFVGEYGNSGPTVGFLGEFDALSGLNQTAGIAEKKSFIENGAGHGCGHNLLGVGSLVAADILKKLIDENKIKAKIKYFGCPGEEGGSGKAFMARDGSFKDLDITFSWHPMNNYEVWNASSMANFQIYYKFKGISSHAAGSPELGRSALDALELMNVGIQFLREHVSSDVRIHYAITNTGGFSPNVVQSYAEVLYLIRAKDLNSLFELKKRVDKIAKGAAMMTETEVEIDFVKGCSNFITNKTMEEELYKSMREIPIPKINQDDKNLIDSLYETVKTNADDFKRKISYAVQNDTEKKEFLNHQNDSIYDFIIPYKEKYEVLAGSTDVGDVSWNCPTGQILTATWPAKVPAHSWQSTAMGKTNHAIDTMIYAGKVLALTAIRMIENPELIAKAKSDFKEKLGEEEYRCPIPKGVVPRKIS